MLELPEGVYPGDWVSGTEYSGGYLGVFRHTPGTGGAHHVTQLRGGQTRRSFDGATTLQVGETLTDTGGRGPGLTYEAAYNAVVSVHFPFRNGLALYEATAEFAADPLAIGWQYEGADFALDVDRCVEHDVYPLYTAWIAADGNDDYNLYRQLNWEEPTGGTLDIPFDGVISPKGRGATFTIGTPGSFTLTLDTADPPAIDRARMPTVETSVTGYTFANAASGVASLPLTALPTSEVAGFGEVVLLGQKIADIPYPYGTLGSSEFDSAEVNFDNAYDGWNGTAVSRTFRLLYAAPPEPELERHAVRRFPRGDGFVLGPRRHFAGSGSTQADGNRLSYR